MSTNRTKQMEPLLKGPNGRNICRYCGEEVAPPRRTFCSDQCVHEWKIRSNPGYAALQVYRRDKGVCAACGLDCDRLVSRWRVLLSRAARFACWYTFSTDVVMAIDRIGRLLKLRSWRDVGLGARVALIDMAEFFKQYPWVLKRIRHPNCRLWDMDHTKPVVEGGGECGLDNLRTLCVPCHLNETRELRKRMKQKKEKS